MDLTSCSAISLRLSSLWPYAIHYIHTTTASPFSPSAPPILLTPLPSSYSLFTITTKALRLNLCVLIHPGDRVPTDILPNERLGWLVRQGSDHHKSDPYWSALPTASTAATATARTETPVHCPRVARRPAHDSVTLDDIFGMTFARLILNTLLA